MIQHILTCHNDAITSLNNLKHGASLHITHWHYWWRMWRRIADMRPFSERNVTFCISVSLILIVIYTSARIKWVEDYLSEAKRLCIVGDLSWEAIGINHNQVSTRIERSAMKTS